MYVGVDSLFIIAPIVGVLCLFHVLLCSDLSFFFTVILIGKRESLMIALFCLPGVL